MTDKLTKDDLAGFIGTEHYYPHSLLRHILYTDGVQFLAEKAGAYWLIDKIATLQLEPKIKAEEFQLWKLVVKDDAGILTCDDGDGRIVHKEEIGFTDFPLDEISIFFADNVIHLPSEY